MESFNLVKVVAAFLAGVVIALGGVLIYVRTNEMVYPQRVAHTSVMPENASGTADSGSAIGQDSSDASLQTPPALSDDLPALKPVPKFQPTLRPPAAKPAPKPVRHPDLHAKKATKPEWQIAQNLRLAKAVAPAKAAGVNSVPQKNNAIPSAAQFVAQAPADSAVAPEDSAQAPQKDPATAVSHNNSPPYPSEAQPAPAPENPTAQEIPAPGQDIPASAQGAPATPQANSTPPQPHTVTLPVGTNVVVRLGETLSTDDNYTGDTFRAHLEAPIIIDGFIIADKGSKVLGRIVNAQKAGRVEGVSELTLSLTEINTTDGQRVKIDTTTWNKKGMKSTGEDAAKIAGGAALGAIIGAAAGGGKGAAIGAGAGGAAGTGVVLATRGKTTTLPVETRITFRLANPVTVTEKLNF